ncbi:hypothetical protein [Actinomadura hibisca]|uniref:hypothetical protein n=1 Tax=Actinomadura hibisca TaxID=68565 RepID=UPI00082F485A|nr:hypothetical protein [Actinomadura hibisca]
MTGHFASKLVGVRENTLCRWATAGMLTYRQDEQDGAFRFLRPELLTVVGMRHGDAPLTIQTIRRNLAERPT